MERRIPCVTKHRRGFPDEHPSKRRLECGPTQWAGHEKAGWPITAQANIHCLTLHQHSRHTSRSATVSHQAHLSCPSKVPKYESTRFHEDAPRTPVAHTCRPGRPHLSCRACPLRRLSMRSSRRPGGEGPLGLTKRRTDRLADSLTEANMN